MRMTERDVTRMNELAAITDAMRVLLTRAIAATDGSPDEPALYHMQEAIRALHKRVNQSITKT